SQIIISISAPILLIIIWELSSNMGLINQTILPSFSKVVETAVNLIESGKLQTHIITSIGRVAKGFLLGAFLGVIVGTIMGFSKFFNRFLGSLVGIFRPVPMIAWIPLLILRLGIGEETKVSLITVGTFWPVLLNTIHGIQSVDPKLLEVAKILKKGKATVICGVILPSALPAMFTGIRLGMGSAWSCVVAAEMIAASKGIGFMITYAREVSKPAEVMVGVFVIGIIGLLIDVLIQKIQKYILKWNYTE
ncbi:MAG: ABC transporter permease, partial [Acutalibacteraceae bacterium]